jgi:hypothetical protein
LRAINGGVCYKAKKINKKPDVTLSPGTKLLFSQPLPQLLATDQKDWSLSSRADDRILERPVPDTAGGTGDSNIMTDDTSAQSPSLQEPGHPLHLFLRPAFLGLTIGIPFCIFKFLFGISLVRAGGSGQAIVAWAGLFILVWAAADMAMNAGNVIMDLAGRQTSFDYCSIAQVGHWLHRPRAFLALDTLMTFSILCLMLWSGLIATLTPTEMVLWYTATTLNLISLSAVSLYREIRHI